MSQLSFHISFVFPPQIPSLPLLRTSGAQWRTLGLPSLASLYFTTLSISTSNTPISFSHLNAGDVDLTTVNASITGTYHLETLELKTPNGLVEGKFIVEGTCRVRSSNRLVKGEFKVGELEVQGANGAVKGTFEGKNKVRIETNNAEIGGTFVGMGSVSLKTSNGAVGGTIRVGRELVLKTSNGPVVAKVELVGEDERESTPPLLVDDVKKNGGSAGGKIKVDAKTSNSVVDLQFVAVPRAVELDLEAKTSNAKVFVRYPAPFDGAFQVRPPPPSLPGRR
jgi:DUF4097 and DUF4098 domain-containing protein YvlB